MKDWVVYILLAVFVALGAAFFFSREQWRKAEEAEKRSQRVLPVESDAVSAFRLENEQGRFELAKVDGEWRLTEPLETRADHGEVSSLLSYLCSLSVERILEEEITEQQKEEFGLLKPDAAIHLDATGERYDLRLGKNTATPNRLYALRSDRPRVMVVERYLRDHLNKSLYDLRDKEVFSFDAGDAERVEYVSPSRRVAAEKERERRWRLDDPRGARADESQVSSLLSRLRSAEAQAFVDEPTAESAVYGLAQPATRVTVWSGPERLSETLVFGDRIAAEGRLYAMKEGGEVVFELEESFLKDIEKKVSQLRDRRLAWMRDWDLELVRIESATSIVFAATRDADRSWVGLEPFPGSLKRYETGDYLRELAAIEIEVFIDDPKPLAEYRLDPPDYRVIFTGEGGQEELLRFGVFPPSATDELDVDVVYALRPDESSVFSVEPRVVSLLHRDFSDLRGPAPTPVAATEEVAAPTGP